MRDRPLAGRHAAPGRIYADYAAGAPLRPEAAAAMRAAFDAGPLNPSSAHWAGARARAVLEDAREAIAAAVGARPLDVVFTSGATEANNLALLGTDVGADGDPVVAALASDHSSVLEPLRVLGARGVRVTTVPVDGDGCADVDALATLPPALLSVALVNAETGVVQDVARIAEIVHRGGGLIHVDAAQAAGPMAIDVTALGADLLTVSGHKIGGPPGTGALVVRRGVRLAAMLHGGPQERGVRPGTENVPAVAGFAAALGCATRDRSREAARLARWRDTIASELVVMRPDARVAGAALPPPCRAAHILNVTLPGLRGESLVAALDLEGVAVSAGSACATGASEPSHVLLAMGWTRDDAESAVRVSLGWATTERDVAGIVAAFACVLGRPEREAHARAGGDAPTQVAP